MKKEETDPESEGESSETADIREGGECSSSAEKLPVAQCDGLIVTECDGDQLQDEDLFQIDTSTNEDVTAEDSDGGRGAINLEWEEGLVLREEPHQKIFLQTKWTGPRRPTRK